MQNTKQKTQKLALLSLLTALVAVLSYLGGTVPTGFFATVNLTLVPVVLGAALLGPLAGAWLGFVSGFVFLFTAGAGPWFACSILGTVFIVLLKGFMAGYCASLVYKLLEKFNRYFAVMVSAVVAPVVNTGIFIGGCLLFFMEKVNADASKNSMGVLALIIFGYAGINFVIELLANIVLGPAIYRIMQIKKK